MPGSPKQGPTQGPKQRPLSGIRVLELARILAGPWAGQVLADLGADVIKVERAGAGDDTRAWGPPFVPAADGGHLSSAYFHSANRGKRSIEVDFNSAEGQNIVKKLAARSDVLIENFKVGGLRKFGLDYESLKPLNPRLIYCSVTGFGQDGPAAARAGYDLMAQGIGGLMGLTGTADGEPTRCGVAVSDIFSGVYSAVGILAALMRRHETGSGGYIDTALVDSTVGVLSFQALNYLVSGEVPKRIGNTHPNLVPYQVFPVADGQVIIATGNDGQFIKLCGILGAPQLAEVEAYKDNTGRLAHRAELVGKISALTSQRTRDELLEKLENAGIPAGPINNLEQVFTDPQVVHRGMQLALKSDDAKGGTIPGLRSPIMLDQTPMASERPAPRLGEHTAEILREIGE
ncbi:MAG TPA: CoA transferase [Xanthobacteraceae bacterium]|jgi:crotonobetainyl-CoA:carnitine CoA-transferase CaiB-like acyl-CoA transferase|nr:CoA transferase [Xanthobacteraceae bacterium]